MNRYARILFATAVAFLAAIRVVSATAQDASVETGPVLNSGHIEYGVAVQLSASHEEPFEGGSTTSTAAEQLELGIGIELHE